METGLIVVLSMISLWMVALAVMILTGLGDGLIAGYNTAGKEERERYDIKRLRIVVAALILFVTLSVWLMAWFDVIVVLPVLFLGFVVGLIITNTWCKKK